MTIQNNKNNPESEPVRWLSQNGLSIEFRVSPPRIGQILTELKLRHGGEPTQGAIDQDLCRKVPHANSMSLWVWDPRKIRELLNARRSSDYGSDEFSVGPNTADDRAEDYTSRVYSAQEVEEMREQRQTERLLEAWHNIVLRCYDNLDKKYPAFGSKGVDVCAEWREDFSAFARWSEAKGYHPQFHLSRIDTGAGYSPKNCRWIPGDQYRKPHRNAMTYFAWGEGKTVTDWLADPRCAVPIRNTLQSRINGGLMTVAEAVSMRHRRSLFDTGLDVVADIEPKSNPPFTAITSRSQEGQEEEGAMEDTAEDTAEDEDYEDYYALRDARKKAEQFFLKNGSPLPSLALDAAPSFYEAVITLSLVTLEYLPKCIEHWDKKRAERFADEELRKRAGSHEAYQAIKTLQRQGKATHFLPSSESDQPSEGQADLLLISDASPGGRGRAPVLHLAFNERKTISEWAEDYRCVVSLATLRQRLYAKNQWSLEQAITTPIIKSGQEGAQLRRTGSRLSAGPAGIMLTAFNETKNISAWLKDPRCRVSRATLRNNLLAEMSVEDALSGTVRVPRALVESAPPRAENDLLQLVLNALSGGDKDLVLAFAQRLTGGAKVEF